MEALRHSLFAPSVTTIFMVFGCAHGILEMVKLRYACKDDNGKPLLPHPYEPWNAPTDPKYKDSVDAVYRAFKMVENIKEWTFLSLPIMWVFALYGGALPYMTDAIMEGIILASGAAYCVGNYWYVNGYIESAAKRLKGFQVRRRVFEFWLLGSLASVVWGGLIRYGIVNA